MIEIKDISFFTVGEFQVPSDLWLTLKTLFEFDVPLYMDNYGNIFTNNPGSIYSRIGRVTI